MELKINGMVTIGGLDKSKLLIIIKYVICVIQRLNNNN
jgi:hypothetical protein